MVAIVFVLINQQWQSQVDALGALHGSPLRIDQNATDPIPTCSFTIDDPGSAITLARLQEVVVIDNDAYPLPAAQNILVNPVFNPYTTNWTTHATANLTLSQHADSGTNTGFTVTANNAALGSSYMQQNTPKGLVVPGQTYNLSIYASASSPVNINAYIQVTWQDATGNNAGGMSISSTFVPTGSSVRYSAQATAPTGAAYGQVQFGVNSTVGGTNSGSITLTIGQLEPTWFSSLGTSYPTSDVNTYKANCYVLPNGTTIRQKRIFAGFVTHWIYGPYSGKNRAIQVDCSGPAFLLDGRLAFLSVTNNYDDQIFAYVLNTYFTSIFSTNHVIRGVQYTGTLAYNGDSARTIFDALASSSGFRYFVDSYYDVWYFPQGYYMAAYGLSDAPDNSTTYIYTNYTAEYDFTQPCNSAYVLVSGGPNYVRTADVQAIATVGYAFDRKINDTSVGTNAAANTRGQAEILAYSYERVTLHLSIDQRVSQASLTPGYAVPFSNSVEGISKVSYLIQKVRITVKGSDATTATRYVYQVDLGTFKPSQSHLISKFVRAQTQSSSTTLTLASDHVTVVEAVAYQDSQSIHP